MVLKNGGTVWAWGSNWWGQFGNGTNTSSYIPLQISRLMNVTQIAAGGTASGAITKDQKAWAWGYNYKGQLGIGSNTDSNIPVQVRY